MLRSTWDEVCARIRRDEDPARHDPWLDRLNFVAASDGVITLATPNHLYVEWVRENVEPLIVDHAERVCGMRFAVRYQFDGGAERPAQAREEAPTDEVPAARVNPRQTFSTFVVGSGNQFAHAACQNVADQPTRNYNPLFLYGGVGLGKTHLLHAIGNRVHERNPRTRIVYMSASDFMADLINGIRFKRVDEFRDRFRRSCDVLLMDDIQFLAGKERTQEEFFHAFEVLHGSGRQIVVTADRYPKDIDGLEERLQSRFDWGLVADIQPPDTETKVAILRKKADEETVELPTDVAFFIARHVNGNVRELEGTLTRLMAMSSFHAAPITLEFARRCLGHYLQPQDATTSVEAIQAGVARYFDMTPKDLRGPRRSRQIVVPRQIAMYLSREHTGLSFPEIGKRFGDRDHTTVLHAVNKIREGLENDPALRAKFEGVARSLGLAVR